MLKCLFKKEVALLLSFIVACMVMTGCGDEVTSKNAALSVKAEDILNDYINDQEAADKKYKNKTVNVTGQVLHKNQYSNSAGFYVVLANKDVQDKNYIVDIAIEADKVDIINKVEEGKYLSVEGICAGIAPQNDHNMIVIQINASKTNQ